MNKNILSFNKEEVLNELQKNFSNPAIRIIFTKIDRIELHRSNIEEILGFDTPKELTKIILQGCPCKKTTKFIFTDCIGEDIFCHFNQINKAIAVIASQQKVINENKIKLKYIADFINIKKGEYLSEVFAKIYSLNEAPEGAEVVELDNIKLLMEVDDSDDYDVYIKLYANLNSFELKAINDLI